MKATIEKSGEVVMMLAAGTQAFRPNLLVKRSTGPPFPQTFTKWWWSRLMEHWTLTLTSKLFRRICISVLQVVPGNLEGRGHALTSHSSTPLHKHHRSPHNLRPTEEIRTRVEKHIEVEEDQANQLKAKRKSDAHETRLAQHAS
ncbi:hypothetical protein CR513_54120, partial [Mucuna pruriens]